MLLQNYEIFLWNKNIEECTERYKQQPGTVKLHEEQYKHHTITIKVIRLYVPSLLEPYQLCGED